MSVPRAEFALGKEFFADVFFAGGSLPSAALGKGFAEGIIAFAECIRHSAKSLNPVVSPAEVHFKEKILSTTMCGTMWFTISP
jgi:hypothetical protein